MLTLYGTQRSCGSRSTTIVLCDTKRNPSATHFLFLIIGPGVTDLKRGLFDSLFFCILIR